ncbi:kinase-like protein [Hypoxylon sp. FL1857]|nr:kinase-like protein [Hypoxylon sp. FL1857]
MNSNSEHHSNSYDSEGLEDFGPLVNIPETSLITLARGIRERVLHASTTRGEHVSRIVGWYSLVHIIQLDDIKLVIRIPSSGWGSAMTETAAHAIESDVATMRFVSQSTSIPVPKIYDFDVTDGNVIKAPYICMSFASGTPISQVWHNKKSTSTTSREDFRLNILRNVAEMTAECYHFPFDKIGSISGEGGGSIGPCYQWYRDDDGVLRVISLGPFDSTDDFIEARIKASRDDPTVEASNEEARFTLFSLPTFGSNTVFVLRPPDYDAANIFVDDQGNITGWIGWEHPHTASQAVMFPRFLSWIMADCAAMDDWPETTEDPPEVLHGYRKYYTEEFLKSLFPRGAGCSQGYHISQDV